MAVSVVVSTEGALKPAQPWNFTTKGRGGKRRKLVAVAIGTAAVGKTAGAAVIVVTEAVTTGAACTYVTTGAGSTHSTTGLEEPPRRVP